MNIDDYEHLENLIFEINDSEISKTAIFVQDLLIAKCIELKHFIYLILYSLRARPRNYRCIFKLLNLLCIDKTQPITLQIADNPIFEELKSYFPKIRLNQYSQYHIISEYFPFNEEPYNHIAVDDAVSFQKYIQEKNALSQLDKKIIEYIAVCGSYKCFDFIKEFIPDYLITEQLHKLAHQGGNIEIIDFFKSMNIATYNEEICIKAAIEAHNFDLFQYDYFSKSEAIRVFSTKLLKLCISTNPDEIINNNSVYLFSNITTYLSFLVETHPQFYVEYARCDIPFIVSCVSGDINSAINQKPDLTSEMIRVFSFKNENNSCYCNAVLALLFSIPEIQNNDFLNQDSSIMDLHLSVIQYYIKTKINNITTQYFRMMLTYFNFGFNKQNDSRELLSVIISKSAFLQSLFKITFLTTKITYSKESQSEKGTIEIVSSHQAEGYMLLENSRSSINTNLGTTCEFKGIAHTRCLPFFGVQFEYQFIESISQFIILDFGESPQKLETIQIYDALFDIYGGLKFTGSDNKGHYIYDCIDGSSIIRFNDLKQTAVTNEKSRYILSIYRNEQNNLLNPQIHYRSTILTDWTKNNYSQNEKQLKTFYEENFNNIQSSYLFRRFLHNMKLEAHPLYNIINEHFEKYSTLVHQFRTWTKNIIEKPYSLLMEYTVNQYNAEFLSKRDTTPQHTQEVASKNTQNKTENNTNSISKQYTFVPNTQKTPFSINSKQEKIQIPQYNYIQNYKKLYYVTRSLYANYIKSSKQIISNLTKENRMLKAKLENQYQYYDDFVKMLVTMTERNKDIPPNNHRFTDEECHKCFSLYIQNKTVYRSYNSHYIMPSLTIMKRIYSEFINKFPFDSISSFDVTDFRKIIEYWLPFLKSNEKLPCILAIDAMCVLKRITLTKNGIQGLAHEGYITDKIKKSLIQAETFSEKINIITNNRIGAQAIFVVQLIPLSNLKPIIVHFHEAPSGSATSAVYKLITQQIKCLINEFSDHLLCYGGAADADPQYRQIHEKNLCAWYNDVKDSHLNLDGIIKNLPRRYLFSPDLSHLTKRLKYRVQTLEEKTLYINTEIIRYDELICYFQGDKAKYEFNNQSFTKMDDDAVHNFFTPRHLLTLFENHQFIYLQEMLPGTILNVIFYDQHITRTDRIQALLIGFFFVFYLYDAIINKSLVECRNSKFKLDSACMTLDQMKDYLNLSIQIIKILHEVQGSFSMSRLGTLDNEHLFSQVREFSYHDETLIPNIRSIKRLIALRIENEHARTKRSHSKFPPAVVEAQVGDLNKEMVYLANSIAQYLLIQNESIDIINPDINIILTTEKCERENLQNDIHSTILQIIKAWDSHYQYPKFKSTKETIFDGPNPSANAQRRYKQNSQNKK